MAPAKRLPCCPAHSSEQTPASLPPATLAMSSSAALSSSSCVCHPRLHHVSCPADPVFAAATCVIHICALVMVIIMLWHIRTKYTAIGRREISLFFYCYLIEELLGIFLDSAIVKTSSSSYGWLVAVHVGLVLAMSWCLMANGLVGFQIWEDGTRKSVLAIYTSTVIFWIIGFVVAAATFKGWSPSLSPTKQTGLYVVHMIVPLVFAAIWLVSQVVLVFRNLDTLWPLGDLILATGFYVIGLVLMFAASPEICKGTKHYVDGLFFGVLSILLAVMMVYKFWDDITKEDLEFSVGNKLSSWEVKDPVFFGSETTDNLTSKPTVRINKAGYQAF